VNVKQIIVVNESLKLPRGKLAAQVAHAAVAAFLEASEEAKQLWLANGMPKVVLSSQSAEELRQLKYAAEERGIPACLIADAGKTILAAETITCLGLGPSPGRDLDELTGELKLVR
jgi:PTH2 family peptidyl-tRNA hydrolase